MRQNLNVTDHATHVAEDQAVVCKTDMAGAHASSRQMAHPLAGAPILN
jgi:hypothetical protein